jgi:hypothetical protein
VPDPLGAVKRILCKKNGTKLAVQENTKQDREEKGPECAPCFADVKCTHTHTHTHKLDGFFQFLFNNFSFQFFGSEPVQSRLA